MSLGKAQQIFVPARGWVWCQFCWGKALPRFPGSERGKLALSWVLGVKKEPQAPEQGGRWLVGSGILRASAAFWELQLGGCCAG